MGSITSLAEIVAFVSHASHPMTLNFHGKAVSAADRAGWEANKETLEAERQRMGLPQNICVLLSFNNIKVSGRVVKYIYDIPVVTTTYTTWYLPPKIGTTN